MIVPRIVGAAVAALAVASCSSPPVPEPAPSASVSPSTSVATTSAPPSASPARPSATTSPRAVPPTPVAHAVPAPRLSRIGVVVALGDSVPYGTRCGCTPYPQDSAGDLAAALHRSIRTYNDSVPGYQTTDVLAQVRGSSTVVAHVRQADLVEIEIGANDIAYGPGCGTTASCYQSRLSGAMTNLDRIVARVRQLRAGKPTTIVLLGYWSVWLGGQYAIQRGADYVNAATTLTRTENAAIQAIARRTGSLYVDLRVAFKGPSDSWDETDLLASDGDHPNAAGHATIGHALISMLRARIPR